MSNVSTTSLGLVINNRSVPLKKGVQSTLSVSSSQQFNITLINFNGTNATMSLCASQPAQHQAHLQTFSSIPQENLPAPNHEGGIGTLTVLALIVAIIATMAVIYLLFHFIAERKRQEMNK